MKIGIVGTRGIPAAYGGFETFAEEVSRRLAAKGHAVTVYCERSRAGKTRDGRVKLAYSHFSKSRNPLLFYLESIFLSMRVNDLLLIAGTGGSLFYFLPRLRNVPVITNIDGIESRREKWSVFQRMYIRLTERLSVKCSSTVIADSSGIRAHVVRTYGMNSERIALIEYGAYINTVLRQSVLDKYGLRHDGYYLVVARLEPENNIAMIIDGHRMAATGKPLVIVGILADTLYVRGVLERSSETVRFLGGVYDQEVLQGLRYSCFSYIHGHSVGGTNPSLLEAMGSGNIVICHDNMFNREVTDSRMLYFRSAEELRERIEQVERLDLATKKDMKEFSSERIRQYYNWDRIADNYDALVQGFARGA